MLQHPDFDRPRVLLLDDDEMISGALFDHLQSLGVVADLATDVETAGKLLRANTYSVVMIDPYLTGNLHDNASALIDTVRLLQTRAQIVVLTAYGAQFTSRLFSDPLMMIIPKPQSLLALVAMIGRLTHSKVAV